MLLYSYIQHFFGQFDRTFFTKVIVPTVIYIYMYIWIRSNGIFGSRGPQNEKLAWSWVYVRKYGFRFYLLTSRGNLLKCWKYRCILKLYLQNDLVFHRNMLFYEIHLPKTYKLIPIIKAVTINMVCYYCSSAIGKIIFINQHNFIGWKISSWLISTFFMLTYLYNTLFNSPAMGSTINPYYFKSYISL